MKITQHTHHLTDGEIYFEETTIFESLDDLINAAIEKGINTLDDWDGQRAIFFRRKPVVTSEDMIYWDMELDIASEQELDQIERKLIDIYVAR